MASDILVENSIFQSDFVPQPFKIDQISVGTLENVRSGMTVISVQKPLFLISSVDFSRNQTYICF